MAKIYKRLQAAIKSLPLRRKAPKSIAL
ncbi:hypothetical protein CCACVL1_12476 [Corchorus capsularis]|uniref:Uncharacterized protein n=1 Tax=Corchorus capsularis TaxID=210143 RepID=A0A1R3IFJ5_COCAP|nr:hypothetical protein CCACVL1_12476 [Corchorus capsularis]